MQSKTPFRIIEKPSDAHKKVQFQINNPKNVRFHDKKKLIFLYTKTIFFKREFKTNMY